MLSLPLPLPLLSLALAAVLVSQEALRSVEIWSEHPIAVDIEWVTIDEAGEQTITAKRMTAVGPPVPLEFVHGADRYVRFRYQGASPRTYSTGELIAARKVHVPDVLPGGELLLLVPPMTVRPAQLLVEGPRIHTVPLEGRVHASLPGVPPGEYRIVPVYEGGLKGAVANVTVGAAETTLLHMPPEQVGAVRIEAAREVCGVATEMGINALVVPRVAAEARPAPNMRARVLSTKEPRCEIAFGGLKPGMFETFYTRQGGVAGSATFEVAAQAVSSALVSGLPVNVQGRVTLNGKPLANVRLTFYPRESGGAVTLQSAQTDAAGFYATAIDRPGVYTVRSASTRTLIGGMKEATLVEGLNIVDWLLTGGTISIVVTGISERSTVNVAVQAAGGRSQAMMGGSWSAGQPHTFGAMPFGDYKVTVTWGGGARPGASGTSQQVKTVSLSAASPEVTVTFDLTK